MKFKLLTISVMYDGFLKSFYKKNPDYRFLQYKSQYEHIVDETSEPVGSYTKVFNRHGIEAACIITNAAWLQKKWQIENGVHSTSNDLLVLEQVKKYRPDVLWIDSPDYFEKKWVDMVRQFVPDIKLIIGSHCAPYGLAMLENLRNLDFILTCTPGMRDEFEKNGLKAFLVYHAFDSDILDKLKDKADSSPENDFIFSGSLFKGGGFHNKRIELLESILKKNIDLKIYGNLEAGYKTTAKQLIYYILRVVDFFKIGKLLRKVPLILKHEAYGENLISNYSVKLKKAMHSPVFGIEMFQLLKKSKIILNIHGDVAGDYAGNVRLFEATGVGSCLLTDYKKNLSELFDVEKEIVVFNGNEDCINKIEWLLANDEAREKIASAGQQKTLLVHSIEERCKSIINIINKELEAKLK
jgi:spore maturation protein CgeB